MGIFPHGARWYLAGIAMLALVCVGIHLSIQIKAQQKAEETILQWGKENGVNIGNVRYHLLRNALILQQVTLNRGSDHISIEHLLVRANPAMLTGTEPRIGSVEIAGIALEMHDPLKSRVWQQDVALERLWMAAKNINLRDGSIRLSGDDGNQPLVIEDITMHRKSAASDTLNANGFIHGVAVQLLRKKRRNMAAITTLSWHEVDAGTTASTFGLTPVEGTLSGWAQWHEGMESAPPLMQGELILHQNEEEPSRLRWHGKGEPDSLVLDLQSEQWPISIWRKQLPRLDMHELTQGKINGDIHAVKSTLGWQLTAQRLDLNQVAFSNENSEAAWSWQNISLHESEVDLANHKIEMSILFMQDGQMQLQPFSSPDHAVDDQPWHINIRKGEIHRTELQLQLPRGHLRIPSMDGEFQMTQNDQLSFRLATSETGNNNSPAWAVRGTIEQPLTHERVADIHMHGRQIAVAQLRALLPLHGSEASALTLEGDSDFDIALRLEKEQWQAHGKATASNFAMTHAGDSWSSEQLSLRFGPIGSDIPTWKIHRIQAENWHYITALQPIPPFQTEDEPSSSEEASFSPFWWAENLLQDYWEIDSLEWKNGAISLGNAEAQWGDKLDLKITPIAKGKKSELTMYGNIGEGELIVAGYWQPLSPYAPFTGNATLQNALPFFLNEWLQASGVPRFIRGRFNAALEISAGEHEHDYISQVELTLRQAECERREEGSDQMQARTGLSTPDLIRQLDDGKGNVRLQWNNFGNWLHKPLTLSRLGHGMQLQLNSALIAKSDTPVKAPAPAYHEETRIRLHQRASITLNESIRMHKVVRKMLSNPDLVIELVPVWPGNKLEHETEARIAFTQRLIGRFLSNRLVGYERIFPILPSASEHSSELGAIIMRTRPRS